MKYHWRNPATTQFSPCVNQEVIMKATDEVEETPKRYLHYSERRILANVSNSESPGRRKWRQVFTSPPFGNHSSSLEVHWNNQVPIIFSEGAKRNQLAGKILAKIKPLGRFVLFLLQPLSSRQPIHRSYVYCTDSWNWIRMSGMKFHVRYFGFSFDLQLQKAFGGFALKLPAPNIPEQTHISATGEILSP